MKELSVTEMVSLCGGADYQQEETNIAVGSFNGLNKIFAGTFQLDPATAIGAYNKGPVTADSQNSQYGAEITIL